MINNDAKNFCKDDISLIENYNKALEDKEQTWHCHHRKGTIISKKELIENNEYYNRPASELIFLNKSEHMALHMKGNKIWLGKHHTEETKQKISNARNGMMFSEEHKKNLSEAQKGRKLSEETKRKMSIAKKSKHHTEETKRKMSESRKGLHWFNNGAINVRARECPEGFVRGMLKKKAQRT